MYRPIQVVLWSVVILCCMRTGAAQDAQRANDTVNQVVAVLLPTFKEIQGNINSVRNDLSNFNVIVNNLTEKVSNLENHISSKMDQIELKLDSKFKAVESQLEEHKYQTTSELAGLLSNMTSILHTINTQQPTTTMKLTQPSTEVDTLDSNLNASIREDLSCIKNNLSTLIETINIHVENNEHMATKLMNLDQLQRKFMVKLTFYFGFIIPIHTCGGTGGWRHVVYLDMTDPNTTCPSGWQLTSYSKKTCGRVSTGSLTCDSVTFPVSGGDYTRVCGRIKGYQYSTTDAFEAYDDGAVTTIDGAYVSGVSLTHGSPRQHIWTFAAGYSEYYRTRNDVCPCDATINITIPQFVGGDYFCESGYNSSPFTRFYPDDPLWDGEGCTANSTCCSFNNPPYFTKQLPSPTTDDIEARICQYSSGEDTPIELIELYVQ